MGILAAALFAPRLSGAFTDGQRGNCGAMFAIMERNARALGWATTYGVPVLNPGPPNPAGPLETYSHHPPGLPWAVMLAGKLPGTVESSSRLLALLLTLCSCWLAADLGARLAGGRAGFVAGLLMLLLPAGLHHGLLVNYETIAIPAMLFLTRSLALGAGRPLVAGLLAGLADWVALLPLLFSVGRGRMRRVLLAACGGAVMIVLTFVLARLVTPSSAGETLAQGLAATFLGSHFRLESWASGMAQHLSTLFGWALLPAMLALPLLFRQAAPLRRVLWTLLGCGVCNVVLFAHHATSHEHFSLILLPYVALSTATLLFPAKRSTGPALLLSSAALLAILVSGALAAASVWPQRQATSQALRADALADVSELSAVYLFPSGAPLVFLHRAQRHVWPGPVQDLSAAHTAVAHYNQRFGTATLPGRLVLPAAASPPTWVEALGPGETAGTFQIWDIPPRTNP
ncbi:MAG: hypothetical protein ACI9EF_002722 [Pseudohongiellaceae bacterium]